MLLKFGDLRVGDCFFDSASGEFYVKLNETDARCASGGDAVLDEVADSDPLEDVA